MSTIGLITLLIYLHLAIPMAVIYAAMFPRSKVLTVRLVTPGIRVEYGPGIAPLRVSLEFDKRSRRASLYVDSQPLPWDGFDSLLKKELPRRPPNWPVYLEGDPEIEWRDAARAIDMIRGSQAQVVLLTPSSGAQK
jgi:hypothetical protein